LEKPDIDIANLLLPYFCVSTDLNEGVPVLHQRGPLVKALCASVALPGILPPVVTDSQVLVDGGVLRNLPSEMMRGRHGGTIIGVDVSQSRGLMAADIARPQPLARWFLSGSWRRGPPIVSILMRAATVGAGPELARSRDAGCHLFNDCNCISEADDARCA
jgi:NTE family protein